MIEIDDNLAADLAEYVDGTLDEAGRARVEKLLDADESLQSLVTKMMIDSERLRALPKLSSPIDLSEITREKLERQTLLDASTPVAMPRRFGLPSVAMAAGLILAVSLGVLGWSVLSSSSSSPSPLVIDRQSFPQPVAKKADEVAKQEQPPVDTTALKDAGESFREGQANTLEPQVTQGAQTGASNETTVTPPTFVATPEPAVAAAPMPRTESSGFGKASAAAAASEARTDDTRTNEARTNEARTRNAAAAATTQVLPEANFTLIADDIDAASMTIQDVLSARSFVADKLADPDTDLRSNVNLQQAPDVSSFAPVQLRARGLNRQEVDEVVDELNRKGLVVTPAAVSRTIEPMDELTVTLVDGDAFNLRSTQRVNVDEAGNVNLPQLPAIEVAGLDIEQAQRVIAGEYVNNRLTNRPQVSVELATPGLALATTRPVKRAGLNRAYSGLQDWVVTIVPATDAMPPLARPTSTQPATTQAVEAEERR
jgi:Polysaccharide biosynthesis/export protein